MPSLWVVEQSRQLNGLLQAAPINRSRSTWQIQRVVARGGQASAAQLSLAADVGDKLLRHCLEAVWEARTWVSEVDVSDEATLALYRQGGFQPLAQITHWQIAPEQLQELAQRSPQLPNLMPVSNADAPLLYQLDTVSMPPLLRQVFDRHVQDFRTSLGGSLLRSIHRRFQDRDTISAYVFEPQRKAAIGYIKLTRSRSSEAARDQPQAQWSGHQAELTVHPAYTWLYPELLAHMAGLLSGYPALPLQLVSADYQPEREQCFEQVQAERVEHRLLLSRSVWHKLRETRGVSFENLQIAEMLQGLQKRQPIPGRISLESQAWDRWDYPNFNPTQENNYLPWPGSQP
ncbi:MAG: GNAT family N-acetyltransferase [Synechococcales cyanobacterium RM1_1_8]|nr:GNAT family N-acetyltransferase [Synechococcales cyanobacterium RM1_1_8]